MPLELLQDKCVLGRIYAFLPEEKIYIFQCPVIFVLSSFPPSFTFLHSTSTLNYTGVVFDFQRFEHSEALAGVGPRGLQRPQVLCAQAVRQSGATSGVVERGRRVSHHLSHALPRAQGEDNSNTWALCVHYIHGCSLSKLLLFFTGGVGKLGFMIEWLGKDE